MTEAERIGKAIPLLILWHRENRRSLPWREDPTPYKVWVSEVMLQQTRIEAAIPHYLRFMERLPDIEALAQVPEEELLKLWEGLGYYSRARNLQKCARTVVREYGGALPGSVQELRSLPGIGEYTAGAIASIALGLPEPAVDGNVLRVALRLLADRSDALDAGTRGRVTELLRERYPSGGDAGLLTEGLMELGETVCLPRGAVRCESCPLRGLCLACERGEAESLPVRSPRPPRRVEERTVLLLRHEGRYAVRQRPGRGLLGGMWEFPGVDGFVEPEALPELVRSWGIEALYAQPFGEAKHLFTHVEWRMRGFLLCCANEAGPFLWRAPEELRREFAIPSAFRYWTEKIL